MTIKAKKEVYTKLERMVKVVYFDEGSALDYIDIANNGHLYEELQESVANKDQASTSTSASFEGKLGILSFFKAKVAVKADSEISSLGDKIWKTTLTNTILTDFIRTSSTDEKIIVFRNQYISTYNNSIAQIKSFTPYLMLIKDTQIEGINISLFDNVLEKAKGYYELVLTQNNESYILRFNINALKNNYCLIDLTKMELTYFCVKVGETELSKLEMSNEFNLNNQVEKISLKEILEAPEEAHKKTSLVGIYDVILAGVTIDGNK